MSWMNSDLKAVWIEHKAVEIEEIYRNKWGIENAEYLIKNEKEEFAYSTSGDSIVFAVKTEDEGIEIFDCKIRRKLRF